MVTTALMAFLHHLMAFTLTACLVYELVAFRRGLTIEEARRIQRADLAYGISAGLLLVVGLLRVFLFEKGLNFYIHSPFFWVQMAAFAIVGLLSIADHSLYSLEQDNQGGSSAGQISETEYKRTRLLLWLEIAGIAIILLAAPMMARGIGMN